MGLTKAFTLGDKTKLPLSQAEFCFISWRTSGSMGVMVTPLELSPGGEGSPAKPDPALPGIPVGSTSLR